MMVLVLALVFLGPKKLPELAAGLGKMIREIRKTTAGIKDEIQIEDNIRKPFEELREAVTLPADELRRRDRWKAEREKREREEAERLASGETEDAEGHFDGHPDDADAEDAEDADSHTETDETAHASGGPGHAGPSSDFGVDDQTTLSTTPGQTASDSAHALDATIPASSAASLIPGAAPKGTVAAGGASQPAQDPAAPPPPPPPAARLPGPKGKNPLSSDSESSDDNA